MSNLQMRVCRILIRWIGIRHARLSVTVGLTVMLLCLACGRGGLLNTPTVAPMPSATPMPGVTSTLTATPVPSATPTPGATFTSTATPTSIATPTPSATATSAPSPTPLPPTQQPLVLRDIQMMTVADGWALERGGKERILRTADGGLTWRDVSVPADRNPGVTPSPAESAYLMNLTDAWVASASFTTSPTGSITSTVTVYRTIDGGNTWEAGTPFEVPGEGPGSLTFLNAQYGWSMAILGAAAGSEAVAIYRTTDGGDTWEMVSLTAGIPGESTPSSLPFGCDKSGLGFANPLTGWATGFCPGGPIFFFVSHDGGEAWARDTLPAPSGYPATLYSQCQCAFNPPRFFSRQDGFLAVGIYEVKQSWQLYVTHDGGTTWSPNPLPVEQPIGRVDMINVNDGWVTDGTTLYRTEDGGQNWDTVGPFPTQDMVGSLNFVSTSDGWFLVEQGIYATHDGGQTWTPITPTLSSGVGSSPTPVVTLSDDGGTIELSVGQRFLLNLGAADGNPGYDWTVTVANPAIVSQVTDVLAIQGSQGLYEARTTGRTTVSATGDPICREAQPPCAAPSRAFSVQIVVK
jgi:photosystem II stability/assembly factor-like uncharacterized protein